MVIILNLLGRDNLERISNYAEYTNYDSEVPYSKFLTKEGMEKGSSYIQYLQMQNITLISLSDFNSLLNLLGKEEVSLGENEYLVFGDISDVQNQYKKL